jgi:hypothetical protein
VADKLPDILTLLKFGENPTDRGNLIVNDFTAQCWLGGDLSVVAKETSTILQVCRQAEIAAAIQHVERRACDKCREAFFHELTKDEKRWLYANDPKLGPVIGVGTEGAEGII